MPRRLGPRAHIEAFLGRGPSACLEGFECFHGYGIMGLTFTEGHVLGLRHWQTSTIGPGYISIWYRNPNERWEFWSTQAPEASCNRYTGEAAAVTRRLPIDVTWISEDRLRIQAPDADLDWEVGVAPTFFSRTMSFAMGKLPGRLRTNRSFLRAMGPLGGRLLRVGDFNMTGKMPNRQEFIAAPEAMWVVTTSKAQMGDIDLGPIGPLPTQASVGDFLMPQRGILAAGSAYFEALDIDRHSQVLVNTSP